MGQVDICDLSNLTLYAEGNILTVIGNSSDGKTIVRTFTGNPQELPVKVGEQSIAGAYVDSRYVNGRAVLVFRAELPFVPRPDQPQPVPGEFEDVAFDLRSVVAPGYYYGGNQISYYGQKQRDGSYPIVPNAPVKLDEDGTVNGVSCTSIAKQYIPDMDFSLNKVVSVNARSIEQAPKVVANLGGGHQIYMTTTGLYVAKQGIQWQPFEPPPPAEQAPTWKSQYANLYETQIITKIAFDNATGELAVHAVGNIQGRIKDQWAFKEYREHNALSVATTTSSKWGETENDPNAHQQHNHLWVLVEEEQKLILKASINNFGPKEDIRAIRYLGTRAYVVTYHKTDPLFAFELENPVEPKLLGELKIPGFSMYLHPIADGRLVGIGFDADEQGDFSWYQGIQVSLFDTSDPNNMARIDNHILGTRGSHCEVTGDHKAFYHNAEYQYVGVPVVALSGGSSNDSGGGARLGNKVEFSGAVLYRLEGTKLAEVTRLTHSELIPGTCASQLNNPAWWQEARRSLDINRLYTVDNRLLSVSRFGIKAHDLADPSQTLTTTKFNGEQLDCSTN